MKKLIALILVLAFCKQIYAQISVNQSLSPTSMISLDYFNTYNSYSSNPNGNNRIGQCLPDGTSTQNGPIFNYVLIVFDLEQLLGGKLNTISNSSVTIQLDGSHGYVGKQWQAGFITSDVSSLGAHEQVNAIRNMIGYSEAIDTPPSIITLPITYQRIVANKIIIGVRRDDAGLQYVSSCTATINGTVLRKTKINVTYNQGSGTIVAYSGNYVAPTAPAQVNAYETNQITIAPLSPTIPDYNLVYNENQAPQNKSYWQKYDNNGYLLLENVLTPASNSFPLLKSEDNWTYEAQMRKLCNVTFQNPGHSITVNGNYYTNSASVSVVEQNTVTATAENYTSDGIEYIFNGWKSDGITYGTTITLTSNKIFTADYTGKPVYVNFWFGGVVNDPIKLIWTDNQNPAVAQYYIYRMQKINGVYTTPVNIGTVNRGVGHFEDYDYTLTYSKDATWLEYKVLSYYTTEGTYSDGGWMTIWGDVFASMQNNDLALAKTESEVPVEFAISNYPNPFNPTTTINYQLPKDGMVTIKVYDVLGKEVATLVNEQKSAGYYKVDFDASTLTSGVYICSIQASSFNKSIKLLLTK